MTNTSLRIIAAIVLALTLAAGLYLSGKARRDAEQRITDLRAGVERSRAVAAEAPPSPELDPRRFEQLLQEDLERFGLTPITAQDLALPNAYFDELREPITLGAGRTWDSPHVRIKVRLDKVAYMQRGARVSSVHAIARVENVSKRPIAYSVVMRGAAGKCEVRGAREHNAISLAPGESAEIVVCAGRDDVRVEKVEVLEVTELGYWYLSQLSPLALGRDATTAAAHEPQVPVSGCVDLDAKTIAAYLQAGTATWADVVDFYSRHDCHRLQFFPGYRRAEEPLPSLPVSPPA
ncbi:hypothetical protein [Paraliomyxa miuraensis]|uniref:hypothetical protein n=1 Tax=Paraliomyxa miuraensis TaxID=376150 RepID=UPI00224E8CB8|nr:hypothetical protein [Paraliomyxa miuraensis]MCX4240261.1 hypothetical protein [Paraliomyxa miuraensis]